MSIKATKQKLPKWFDGELYKEGDIVSNPYSGEEIKLNNIELSIYDFLMGAQLTFSMGYNNEKIIKDFQKGLDWFKKNNVKAYMVLLD